MAIRNENLIANLLFSIDEASVRRARDVRSELSTNVSTEAKLDVDNKSLGDANRQIGGLGKGLAGLAKIGAGIGLAQILKDISLNSLNAASAFETTQASFEVLLGSTEKAEKLLASLDAFSIVTPFEPTEIQAAAKTLLSFSRSAEQVEEDIKLIGEASAATGADLGSLATVYGQVAAVGKLQGGDALQLINQGLPVYDLLSQSLGKSVGELKKLQEQGRISFSDLQGALRDAASEGGRFFGALEKQSTTLEGLRSTFSGIQNAILKAFGDRILGAAKAFLTTAIEIGKAFLEFVSIPAETQLEKNIRSINEEQVSLNVLIGTITDANTSEEERKKLIGELNREYPDFLGNLSAETVSNEQLTNRLREANEQYVIKIALARKEDEIEKIREKAAARSARAIDLQSDARQRLAQIRQNEGLQGVGEGETLLDRIENTLIELGGSTQQALVAPESLTPVQQSLASLAANLSLAGQATRESGKLTDEATELQQLLNQVLKESGIILRSNTATTKDSIEPTTKAAKEIVAQAGSVQFLRDEISKLQKQVNTTTASSPEQLGYAKEIERLQLELTKAQLLLDNLLNNSLGVDINIPVRIDFDPGVSPQRDNTSELERQLKEDLRLQELSQSQAELSAIGNNEELSNIRLQGLKDRRQILLASGVADAQDFINISAQIAEAEFALEESKTEKVKEESEKRRDLALATRDELLNVANQLISASIENKNREVSIQEERVSELLGIADRGNAEQLQLEEERLRKIKEEREKSVRAQRQIAAAQIAIENSLAIAGAIRLIATSQNPLDIALRSILVAATIASTIATLSSSFSSVPSFYKGTESVPGATTKGTIIEAHGKERILTADQNKPLLKLGVKNKDIPSLVEMGLMFQSARIRPDLMSPVPNQETKELKEQNKQIMRELKKTRLAISSIKVEQNIDGRGVRQMVDTEGKKVERRKNLRR